MNLNADQIILIENRSELDSEPWGQLEKSQLLDFSNGWNDGIWTEFGYPKGAEILNLDPNFPIKIRINLTLVKNLQESLILVEIYGPDPNFVKIGIILQNPNQIWKHEVNPRDLGSNNIDWKSIRSWFRTHEINSRDLGR